MDRPQPLDELITHDPDEAVTALRRGHLIGLPTETVYGLGCDAENDAAVRRIFTIKGRPNTHPLIVHLGPSVGTDGWVAEQFALRGAFDRLAQRLWPGPLTILAPAGPRVHPMVTGNRPTVGIRVPAHPLAQITLDGFGGGVAAPSANRFGRVSPTTADHVVDDIGTSLVVGEDVILDGGPSDVGIESTIVDLASGRPQILRAGAIGEAEIEAIVRESVVPAEGPSRASGMLAAHYAPACEVIAVESRAEAEALAERRFGAASHRFSVIDRPSADESARWLYADLRAADHRGVDVAYVVLPAAGGIGTGVRDRVAKAAAGSAPK